MSIGHTNHIKFKRPELYSVPPAIEEPKPISVRIMPDGPIVIEGTFKVIDGGTEKELTNTINSFCRCGGTKSPPYCDGEHRIVGFVG